MITLSEDEAARYRVLNGIGNSMTSEQHDEYVALWMKMNEKPAVTTKPATAQTSDIVAQASGEMSEVDLLNIIPSTQLVKDYANKVLPWVQKPFILRGEVTILVGAANLGKTTFVLQMLWRGATGKPWFLSEKPGATFRSLYFSLEMGEHPLSIR